MQMSNLAPAHLEFDATEAMRLDGDALPCRDLTFDQRCNRLRGFIQSLDS